MKRNKNIFGSDSPVTRDEIEKYINKSGSKSQIHKTESKMADEFDADAVEGFEEFPDALSDMNDLQSKWDTQLKKTQPFWKFQYTLIVSFLSICALFYAGSILFTPEYSPKEVVVVETPIKEVKVFEEPITELTNEEIDKSEDLPKDLQVSAAQVIVESPIVIDTFNDQIEPQVKIERSLEIKKITSLKIEEPIEVPTEADLAYSNVKTLHLADLLVVDYSVIYNNAIPQRNPQMSGTPASLENKDAILNEAQENQSFIIYRPYIEVLEEAQNHFMNDNYKSALKVYKLILKHFPNDLNAHFYSGLCYHNINKAKKALAHFERVVGHQYNTFDQEGVWYSALCHKELKNESEYIQLLNKIANGDGYYSKKAAKLLEKI